MPQMQEEAQQQVLQEMLSTCWWEMQTNTGTFVLTAKFLATKHFYMQWNANPAALVSSIEFLPFSLNFYLSIFGFFCFSLFNSKIYLNIQLLTILVTTLYCNLACCCCCTKRITLSTFLRKSIKWNTLLYNALNYLWGKTTHYMLKEAVIKKTTLQVSNETTR